MKTSKKVVITGGTGAIGRALAVSLLSAGYDVCILTRNTHRSRQTIELPVTWIDWDPTTVPSSSIFEGVDGVIHLAGEPVAKKRWSAQQKKEILNSRLVGTRNLAQAIQQTTVAPEVVISTSAIGFYGDRGTEELTESSSGGSTFLSTVCDRWEAEIQCVSHRSRLAIVRVGIVLDSENGALAQMLPLFRLGLGASLGTGSQWMSWIHHNDLVALFTHILKTESIRGVVNGVAPHPVTNRVFTQTLGHYLARWIAPRVPATLIQLALGEMSTIVLSSQKVTPTIALQSGFKFRYPKIEDALSELVAPNGWKNAYRFNAMQWLPQSPDSVFEFFSNATNLEAITPPWLNFKITQISGSLNKGTLIDYRLKIKGIPIKWRTLISHWDPIHQFSDEMIVGPYRTWHHTHTFEPMAGGTLMTDSVIYRLPFGVLGDIAELIMVRRDVRSIFDYRRKSMGTKL
ncbi:TIGR01777 family protein [bacterium]|nr:TIGR01777 family protein [bacterium]